MHNPIANQANNRNQFAAGSESISTKQLKIPRMGTIGTNGHRKGRGACGFTNRITSTAAQTMTNANNVPMFVNCKRASIGNSPVSAATTAPIIIVLIQGVLNLGCTLAKRAFGTNPSRAIAKNTRGALSSMTSKTEVIPATPAEAMITSAQASPRCRNASDTPALTSIWSYLTIPVSTATTAIYKIVQMISDAMIPIGTSRCGFF